MIWLTWRQFRTQAMVGLAVLAAAAVYLLITGTEMRHAYSSGMTACRTNPASPQCDLYHFWTTWGEQQQLINLMLIAVPALLGIFWGAPLIAGELERGTHRMVWNQSITPARWLSVKLVGVGLACIAAMGLLTLVISWWSGPLDQYVASSGLIAWRFGPLGMIGVTRFAWNSFGTHGVVPLGYAAFAFALGALFGLLTRRAVPAMALTIAVFIGVQAFYVTQVRPNIIPASNGSVPVTTATFTPWRSFGTNNGHISIDWPGPTGTWLLSESDLLNSSGQPISSGLVNTCFGQADIGACFARYDLHIDYTYEPASSYWPLQWSETGIYVALAGLIGGVCVWRLRRQPD